MVSSSSVACEEKCAVMSISEEEECGLEFRDDIIEEVEEDNRFTLVGTLLIDNPVKFHIMRATMMAVWRPAKGISTKTMRLDCYGTVVGSKFTDTIV
nr:uncharacterized protein LOC109179748 [Ipomoea batatas]